jgi:hypothetical protein
MICSYGVGNRSDVVACKEGTVQLVFEYTTWIPPPCRLAQPYM